ncbi:hypothetical protein DIC82_05330 [Clostridium beijerinckii]|nr:hypothetical protein DIC82_05330 [Clostridium beijerinckii]
MSAQDVATIISAGGAVISAITAFVAVKYQIKSQQDLNSEKQKISQAKFCCIGYRSSGKTIYFEIINQNSYPVSDINVSWRGEEKPICNVYYPKSPNDKYDFEVSLNFSECDNIVLNNFIKITYKNIYDNEFIAKKKIKFPINVPNESIDWGNKMFINE